MTQRLAHHPYADLFPMMSTLEHEILREDIAENGLLEEVVLLDGQILDGRNRYKALCELADAGRIEAELIEHETSWLFVPFSDENSIFSTHTIEQGPLAFVVSKNLSRRHLNESQRAMVAAKLANLGEGRPAETAPIGAVSQEQAAEKLNVSRRSVQRASEVQERAAPELQQAVERGDVSVSAAAEVATLPKAEQKAIVLSLPVDDKGHLTKEGMQAFRRVQRDVRALDTQKKKENRNAREQQLAGKILALPDRKFGVILEDFEWDEEVYSRETGMDRHPSNHYPTSKAHTPQEIIAITAERFAVAADDCVLFMWTTLQHQWIAMQVMALRGFEYKSQFAWRKNRLGMGRWNRNKHEVMLVGTRGNVVAPAPGTQFDSCLDGDVREHSRKPDWQYEIAEAYFPNIPKIELNARNARPGWTAWGLDAPEASEELPPHDPETGEIIETSSSSTVAGGDQASAAERAGSAVLAAKSPDMPEIPLFLRRTA